MGLPKGYIKKLNIKPQNVGLKRRQELLDNITNHGTLFPRGVDYEDMDKSFVNFIKKDLSLSIEGNEIPVIFLTIQRWSEFTRTWQFTDEYKDIKMPFITIVRKPDAQPGTNQNSLWNIPGYRKYTYIKVPTWDGVRRGVDLYKIPQPVSVDLTYDVRLFCNKMRDMNKYNKDILRTFSSRQHYIYPNSHPMPVHLETVSDESTIDSFDERRFYVQNYEMKLLGYVLNEKDFEVQPAVTRSIIMMDVEKRVSNGTKVKDICTIVRDEEEASVEFIFLFNNYITSTNQIPFDGDYRLNSASKSENILSYIIKINGVTTTLPTSVKQNDILEILVNKQDVVLPGEITISGEIAN